MAANGKNLGPNPNILVLEPSSSTGSQLGGATSGVVWHHHDQLKSLEDHIEVLFAMDLKINQWLDYTEELLHRVDCRPCAAEETIRKLGDKIDFLTRKFTEFLQTNPQTPTRESKMASPRFSGSHFGRGFGVGDYNYRRPRLKFPKFDGNNVDDWLFMANKFFQLHHTPEEEKVRTTILHLTDDAKTWWHSMQTWLGEELRWTAFSSSARRRFGLRQGEDLSSELFKLQQDCTIEEYVGKFEKLLCHVLDVKESYLISCFIKGLKLDIRGDVRTSHPQTLGAAVERAQKGGARIGSFMRPSVTNVVSKNSFGVKKEAREVSKLPMLKLIPKQAMERRNKGLHFRCDDKWNLGHRCKAKYLLVLQGPEDAESDEDDGNSEEETMGFGERAMFVCFQRDRWSIRCNWGAFCNAADNGWSY